MSRVFQAFTERSLVVQLGVLVFACQLLAHALTIVVSGWRAELPDPARFVSLPALKAGAIAELLSRATPAERDIVLALMVRAESAITIVPASIVDVDAWVGPGEPTKALRRLFPAIATQVGVDRGGQRPLLPGLSVSDVYVRVDDTRALSAPAAVEASRLPLDSILLRLTIFLVVVPIALGTVWALLTLTAPLRRFAATADRFADNLDQTPLPVRGSAEIRSLAHAFNTMRERIRDLVDGRSRMLAAVSHDLRTPLTRLRLRAEAMPPCEDRDRSLRDITAMDKMIAQALTYLRDGAARTTLKPVDLSSVLATIADDFSDTGGDVSFHSPGPIVALADPDALVRALGNLVENALKFGSEATLSLCEREADILIDVTDAGPGIPQADRERVFEPFTRGDVARTGPTSFGLGLAITRQIIERHGGRIELLDGRPTGLVARVVLPRPSLNIQRLAA